MQVGDLSVRESVKDEVEDFGIEAGIGVSKSEVKFGGIFGAFFSAVEAFEALTAFAVEAGDGAREADADEFGGAGGSGTFGIGIEG